jgi:hypothetical protein
MKKTDKVAMVVKKQRQLRADELRQIQGSTGYFALDLDGVKCGLIQA